MFCFVAEFNEEELIWAAGARGGTTWIGNFFHWICPYPPTEATHTSATLENSGPKLPTASNWALYTLLSRLHCGLLTSMRRRTLQQCGNFIVTFCLFDIYIFVSHPITGFAPHPKRLEEHRSRDGSFCSGCSLRQVSDWVMHKRTSCFMESS